MHFNHGYTGVRPLLQDASRVPDLPLVPVSLQLDKFGVRGAIEIHRRVSRFAPRNLVDATGRPTHAIAIVTLPIVRPVGEDDISIRTALEGNASEPRIVCLEEIRGMTRAKPSGDGIAAERLLIDPATHDIVQKCHPAISLGPAVAQINHRADV